MPCPIAGPSHYYDSHSNCAAAQARGITPVIPRRENSRQRGRYLSEAPLEPIQEVWIHDKGLVGQPPEHETDHGETDEGGGFAGVTLEVAGKAAVAADPGKGALDDPALGQDDEAVQIGALDDLELPAAGLGDRVAAVFGP